MSNRMIQQIWKDSYEEFLNSGQFLSDVQQKASRAIVHCKPGALGTILKIGPQDESNIRNSFYSLISSIICFFKIVSPDSNVTPTQIPRFSNSTTTKTFQEITG